MDRKMENKKPVITIIGLGLIGSSLAYALKKKELPVNGVSKGETIEKAMGMEIIDRGFEYSQMEEAISGSEFVFICTPLKDIGERIPKVFSLAGRNTVVSDVGSTKTVICRIAASHQKKGMYFIGGHPMAGSEKRGVENANPYLYYDAIYVLTPLERTPKGVVKKLSTLLSLLGAKVMILNPELHDRIAASVSHLPQLLSVLLTNHLAYKNNDLFRNLAAGGFRDMTRIASSSYSVWRDIIKTNGGEISMVLKEFRKEFDLLLSNLDNEDYLSELFERAKGERETIPRYSKGFLKPLFDVRVSVRDRPGELAKITNIIYYNDINIKDIEIVNVREGEGGILRLGFSEKNDAVSAASALKRVSYEVSVVD